MSTRQIEIIQNRLGFDGRTRVLDFLVQRCNELGVEPDIVCFSDNDGRNLIDPARRFRIVRERRRPAWPRGHIADQLRVVAVQRRRHADAVLIYDGLPAGRCGATRVAHLVCSPLPATLRNEAKFGPIGRAAAPIVSRVLRAGWARPRPAPLYTATSAFAREQVIDTLAPDADVRVLYPPVAVEPGVDADEGRPPEVVVLGRIEPSKVPAASLVAVLDAAPAATITVVGQADDAGHVEALRRLGPRVQVLAGVDDTTRHSVLRRATVLLHPKRYEHFGLAPVEAIAHGCLPVVHDSGGSRETVPDTRLRFTDADGPAATVARVLADTSAQAGLRASLRAHVERTFAPAVVAPDYDRFLTELLGP